MKINVLGPVEVVVDGETATIGSHHARKLLAALVVGANHVVSIDQLADVLWGDRVPASRDNTIQSYIHRLRHEIGHSVIVREDHGYMLRIEVGQLDALEFEALLADAVLLRDRA